jgi:hypothetical protein
MANWLQKIASKGLTGSKNMNLPAPRQNQFPSPPGPTGNQPNNSLPNASIIYGVAASVLFVFGLYMMFGGRWFTGFLIWLPGVAFVGFALQYMKR